MPALDLLKTSAKSWYSSGTPSKLAVPGDMLTDQPAASGVATWRRKHWEPCMVLSCLNASALMRVTLRVTPGFVRSAGLAFGGAGSGFAIMGFFGSRTFGCWTGGCLSGVFVWNIMRLWTQSIKGLYWFSQWYPSTRVQLKSKGVM